MKKLLLLSTIVFFSCEGEKSGRLADKYFDLPGFTTTIVTNMTSRQADVEKRFGLNGESETRVFKATDSLFWTKELSWLKRIDLNTPKYRDLIVLRQGEPDKSSNLLIDRISITNDDLDLKELEIYYLDDISQVRIIRLKIGNKNFLAESKGQMAIWLNKYGNQLLIDSLVTSGQDKVLFQGSRQYRSHLERIRK